MTKTDAKMAFQAIYDAASKAGCDPTLKAAHPVMHDIRNIALKAMMDLNNPPKP